MLLKIKGKECRVELRKVGVMKNKEKIFLFTTEQWLGIALLTILAASAMIGIKFLQPKKEAMIFEVTDSTKNEFKKYQAKQDSTYKTRWKKKPHKRKDIKIRMQPFDPNTADSITLIQLGLKPWQAKNLIKYRNKGGKYRKPEDLKKLYGMTDSMYLALEPYIRIPDNRVLQDTIQKDSLRTDSLYKWKSIKRDTILNLRTADTTELKMIRGIGSYRAKQIVRYRDQLGGYVNVAQIMEAKGMNKAIADSILPHFFIDSVVIKPLEVNKLGVEVLSRHPYISFEQAKAIYEYRRKHIHINSLEDLYKIKNLDSTFLKKIALYLDFSY